MLPKHEDLWLSALELLGDGRDWPKRDFEEPLARRFELTDDERAEMYDSGNGPIFYDRIGWALSYLYLAGLIDKPKRAVFRINELGRSLLSRPEQLHEQVWARLQERERAKVASESSQRRDATLSTPEPPSKSESDLTPQERLYESFDRIRQSIYSEIIDTVLAKSPQAFEQLVVDLLQKMGYGGQIEDAGEVTEYTNDGGIDGVIKEDVLGLGRIHIQAKRYSPTSTVGRTEVQRFVGALAVAQSKKGVFITTSSYSRGALEYASSLHGSTTLVLIDGEDLARFIYDYGLGMQVEQTIEIKKLDADFWDAMQDAS